MTRSPAAARATLAALAASAALAALAVLAPATPALVAPALVGEAPSREPRLAPGVGPLPILVVFNLHADPITGDRSAPLAVQQAQVAWQRENFRWVLDHARSLPEGARPRLNLQMGGDQGEWYAKDAAGQALLRDLVAAGGSVGLHMHDHVRVGEHAWERLRRSGAGEACTDPDGLVDLPEPVLRRNWEDHLGVVDALYAETFGVTAAEARAMNDNAATFLPARFDWKERLWDDYAFPIETGGRGECFKVFFDHNVWHPWRSGPDGPLDESPDGHVVVSNNAVIGNTGVHFGHRQDLSVPDLQREFLALYLTWREAAARGEDRVWVFGWGGHGFDFAPADSAQRRTHRGDLENMTRWLRDFVGAETPEGWTIAEYANPRDVARAFEAWEARHPGASSFEYLPRGTDWSAYPFAYPGLAEALVRTHFAAWLPAPAGARAALLEKCPVDGYWEHAKPGWGPLTCYARDGREARTTPMVVAWSETGLAVPVDVRGPLGDEIVARDPVTGAPVAVAGGAVVVAGAHPVVAVPAGAYASS